MERKFKTGDIVVLKSGSPLMTVSNYKTYTDLHNMTTKTSESHLIAYWFDGNKKLKGEFQQDMLEIKNNE